MICPRCGFKVIKDKCKDDSCEVEPPLKNIIRNLNKIKELESAS